MNAPQAFSRTYVAFWAVRVGWKRAGGKVLIPICFLPLPFGAACAYVIFTALAPQAHQVAFTCSIISGVFALAYAVWRFFENAVHPAVKKALYGLVGMADRRRTPEANSLRS